MLMSQLAPGGSQVLYFLILVSDSLEGTKVGQRGGFLGSHEVWKGLGNATCIDFCVGKTRSHYYRVETTGFRDKNERSE